MKPGCRPPGPMPVRVGVTCLPHAEAMSAAAEPVTKPDSTNHAFLRTPARCVDRGALRPVVCAGVSARWICMGGTAWRRGAVLDVATGILETRILPGMALWNRLFYDFVLVVEHDDRHGRRCSCICRGGCERGMEGLAIALAGIMTSLASRPRRARAASTGRRARICGHRVAALDRRSSACPSRSLALRRSKRRYARSAHLSARAADVCAFCTRRVCCIRATYPRVARVRCVRCRRSDRDVRGMVCVAGALMRPPPTVPVVAIQGNIAQSLKWQPGSLDAPSTFTPR